MMQRPSPSGMAPTTMRTSLGRPSGPLPDDLADLVPDRIGVDLITIDLAGSGYLLSVGEHPVIVAATSNSWFHQNFTIAHELGHLSMGTLCTGAFSAAETAERAANRFAAELLLPEQEIRSINWNDITLSILAEWIWVWGVSTEALRNRLQSLSIVVSDDVDKALSSRTQALLRKHLPKTPGRDLITARVERASRRRFPTELVSRLELAVANGHAPAESLAFALGVDVHQLDIVPAPGASLEDDLSLLEGLE